MNPTSETSEPIELVGIHEGLDRFNSVLRILSVVVTFVIFALLFFAIATWLPISCNSDSALWDFSGTILFIGGLLLAYKLVGRWLPRKTYNGPIPKLRISATQVEYWPDRDGQEVVRMDNLGLKLLDTRIGTLHLGASEGRELHVFRYYAVDHDTLPSTIRNQVAPHGGRFVLEFRGTGRLGLDYIGPTLAGDRIERGCVRIL